MVGTAKAKEECLDHYEEKYHIIKNDGTRYCKKCGEDLFQCDLCNQWYAFCSMHQKCQDCGTRQCTECAQFIENGGTILIKCSKRTSWNRLCDAPLGTGSGMFLDQTTVEELK